MLIYFFIVTIKKDVAIFTWVRLGIIALLHYFSENLKETKRIAFQS
jgi:hypothetical protein